MSSLVAIPRSPISSPFKSPTSASASVPAEALSAASPLDTFAADPVLSTFLSPNFSTSTFSSSALSSGSPASTAEKLHSSILLLDSHLRSLVLSRHEDLLSHLSTLHSLPLPSVRHSLSSLSSSLQRLRTSLSSPLLPLHSLSSSLLRIHESSSLLHHSLRVLRISRKLHESFLALNDQGSTANRLDVDKGVDLSKSAQLYREFFDICEEYDLAGLDVVDEEIQFVSGVGERIRKEGMRVLEKGMGGLNQAEVGTGLQVFYNLGELRSTVEVVVGRYKAMGAKSVSVAFDMKAVGGGSGYGPGGVRGSGTPGIGGGGKAREEMWRRVEECLDKVATVVISVWHLQRVLSKKRDPFTHVVLLEEVIQESDPMLSERVWDAIVKAFTSQMKSASTASSFVKEIFTMGYPKMLSLVHNLLERISRDTDVKGVLPALTPEGKEQMLAAIDIFQNAYLGHCLSRLTELVNNSFPISSRGSLSSREFVSKTLTRIQEEIEAVQLDARLTILVLRQINKALLRMAEQAEIQISTGPDARQMTGPVTSAQLKNFAICQTLQEVHTRVSTLIRALPPIAADELSSSLGVIYGTACDAVTSLFQALLDRLESCILHIHDQNFGALGMDAAMDNNVSPYMEELQKCILHFRSEFLSKMLTPSTTTAGVETICSRLLRNMASRVLVFFIRHASLIRPLSESGKLRLARDMAELELAVGQNLFKVEQLGASYRALRAFRPLIFLETSQLGTSSLLQDLPLSVILHHLYSRGPDDLLSPLQRNRLTPVQYSLWMDSQGEDQIWRGIKATLDDYASKVRQRGDKEFSPVYPLMLQLGSSLTETASAS